MAAILWAGHHAMVIRGAMEGPSQMTSGRRSVKKASRRPGGSKATQVLCSRSLCGGPPQTRHSALDRSVCPHELGSLISPSMLEGPFLTLNISLHISVTALRAQPAENAPRLGKALRLFIFTRAAPGGLEPVPLGAS